VSGAGENETMRVRLAVLRDRLRENLAEVAGLSAIRRRRHEIGLLLADLDRQLERIGRAAVVTLVGATGSGKSTLINALAGQPIAREGIDRPTTERPVIYAPEDADLGDLLVPAGKLGASGGGSAAERGFEPLVVRHEAAGPWGREILIDAPDLNSVDARHRAIVMALADRSDVLLVVLHHQSVVEAASASFVDEFAGRRRLVLVLNRADELTEAARDELLAQVRELAATRWQAADSPVVAVSARAAQSQPHSEGWAELCTVLQALARASAIGGARRLNALGVAARLARVLRAAAAEAEPDLAALPAEIAAGFEALASRVAAEGEARLRIRRADLNGLLWAEAAKRWDGPGGLALRAGGLGSLGVVAGTALLRRSPLVAAGAAGGGISPRQVQ
jgi:energy-coupling factor transporter ATP-binding protein EcfA2